jgi:hypothetical protein
MASLLLRVLIFIVVLPFLVLWLAAGAITWGADAILSSSRERPKPPFGIARRTSDARFGSTVAVFVVLLLVFGLASGGGGNSAGEPEREDEVVATATENRDEEDAEAREARREADARALRAERRAARLERRLRAADRRRARLAAERRRERREAREREALLLAQQREQEKKQEEQEEQELAAAEDCHPSYDGACLDPNASDYDCEGGSGDGPEYTGTVAVVGPDEYDLERDNDGIACDAS